jgi:hypothetical protein
VRAPGRPRRPRPLGPRTFRPGPLGPRTFRPGPLGPRTFRPGPLGPRTFRPGPLGPSPSVGTVTRRIIARRIIARRIGGGTGRVTVGGIGTGIGWVAAPIRRTAVWLAIVRITLVGVPVVALIWGIGIPPAPAGPETAHRWPIPGMRDTGLATARATRTCTLPAETEPRRTQPRWHCQDRARKPNPQVRPVKPVTRRSTRPRLTLFTGVTDGPDTLAR